MQVLNNKGTKINILGSRRVREVLGETEGKDRLLFYFYRTSIIICLNIQVISFTIITLSCSKHPPAVVTLVGYTKQWKMLAVTNIFQFLLCFFKFEFTFIF